MRQLRPGGRGVSDLAETASQGDLDLTLALDDSAAELVEGHPRGSEADVVASPTKLLDGAGALRSQLLASHLCGANPLDERELVAVRGAVHRRRSLRSAVEAQRLLVVLLKQVEALLVGPGTLPVSNATDGAARLQCGPSDHVQNHLLLVWMDTGKGNMRVKVI